jgi:hypothetical protein
MNVTSCKREGCINDLLQRVLDYGERMINEPPYSLYEMEGRLMSLFGTVCVAAGEMHDLEKKARRTLLAPKGFDFQRDIAKFKGLRETLKGILDSVPLFRDRDYQKYPPLTIDDITSVREEFIHLEQLPHCDRGRAKSVHFDATTLAYKMYDFIFMGLKGIALLMQNMFDDHLMLHTNPEMRAKRWQRMVDDYLENHDETGTCPLSDYIFDNQDKLTLEQINGHLKTIHHRQLLEQEKELHDLRQPAVGAYADLFTCRAAQEMTELLAPIIAKYVDFEYGYQYGAWVKAMMDLRLIRTDKRNGTAIIRFVNKTFGKQIDKTTLFRCLSKEDDFEKIRDLYEAILSVISQEMGREPRFCILQKAL